MISGDESSPSLRKSLHRLTAANVKKKASAGLSAASENSPMQNEDVSLNRTAEPAADSGASKEADLLTPALTQPISQDPKQADHFESTAKERPPESTAQLAGASQHKATHRIYDWYLKPVPNDPAETRAAASKWIVVEGVSEDGKLVKQSSRIVQANDRRLLCTNSGSEYQLAGPMNVSRMQLEFSRGFTKKFTSGFPQQWKSIIQREFPHSEKKSKPAIRKARRSIEPARNSPTATAGSSSGDSRTSRLGRKIVKPLAYWNNERKA